MVISRTMRSPVACLQFLQKNCSLKINSKYICHPDHFFSLLTWLCPFCPFKKFFSSVVGERQQCVVEKGGSSSMCFLWNNQRGQNPPSLAAAGVVGARSLPWRAGGFHSGLVGAKTSRWSRPASVTVWAKEGRHAATAAGKRVCDQWPWSRRS